MRTGVTAVRSRAKAEVDRGRCGSRLAFFYTCLRRSCAQWQATPVTENVSNTHAAPTWTVCPGIASPTQRGQNRRTKRLVPKYNLASRCAHPPGPPPPGSSKTLLKCRK